MNYSYFFCQEIKGGPKKNTPFYFFLLQRGQKKTPRFSGVFFLALLEQWGVFFGAPGTSRFRDVPGGPKKTPQ